MGISYHAFVIKDNTELVNLFKESNPDKINWEIIAHHVTLGMGPLPISLITLLGKTFNVKVTHIGQYADNAVAVKVIVQNFDPNLFAASIKTPHITIAVNRAIGAKPFESNKITIWQKLKKEINLDATLYNLDNNSHIVK
jgi:hypothetical protein